VPAPTTPTRLISIAIHLILYSTRLQDPVRSTKTFESNTAQAWPD